MAVGAAVGAPAMVAVAKTGLDRRLSEYSGEGFSNLISASIVATLPGAVLRTEVIKGATVRADVGTSEVATVVSFNGVGVTMGESFNGEGSNAVLRDTGAEMMMGVRAS